MKMPRKENEVTKIEDHNSKKKAPKKHRILKIIGFTTLVCILFSIPLSAVNDIGKPSTDPDDYVKEYEVVAGPEEIAAKNATENAKAEDEVNVNDEVTDQTNEPESTDTEDAVQTEEANDPVETDVYTNESEPYGMYNGYSVADPADKDAVIEAAKQWIDEGTIIDGSAFSAYDESLPISLNQIDLLDADGSSDLYHYVENRTSEYLKQAVFFLYFWDSDGMPIIVSHGGNDALNGNQYVHPVTVYNLAPHESVVAEDYTWLSYYDIQYIGAIPVAYETMEGQIWNNAYMSNFMERSGCYVWEFRDVAQTAVFDFYK